MFLRNMAIAAALLIGTSSATTASPGLGAVVTDTSFTTAGGQTMTLGDLRGEVVVLTYWVTDCTSCEEQLNTLDYYYRQRRDVGLRVLAIASEEMSDRELRSAFKGKAIHPLSRLRGPFDPMNSFPTTYVIDRNGQLRYAVSGPVGIERLNEMLVPLLKQPQP